MADVGYIEDDVKNVNVPQEDGVITFKQAIKLIEEIVNAKRFYQIEPAEVEKVYLTQTDLIGDGLVLEDGSADFNFLGSVRARLHHTQPDVKITECSIYKPLIGSGIRKYPNCGESVLCYQNKRERFYLPLNINYTNNPNNNSLVGASRQYTGISSNVGTTINVPNKTEEPKLGNYFQPNGQIKRLFPAEGDTTIEGRFGNTIRLGSSHTFSSDKTEPATPNIIIRAGQRQTINNQVSIENINKDSSTIYLSSLEQVKINVTKDSEVITGVKEFEQPQIILNSERIIFNSRVDGIGLFANTNIGILAKEKVVLETPQVIVGSNTATEPQVLGQILFDKISALVDAIGNVTGIPTPTGPTPGPVSAAPTWPNVITARDAIKDALSEQHKIDK
tara:strand:+ start:1638 stop:2810 length:1173 start_codon:yes stop_codon:yes gene_type:complete